MAHTLLRCLLEFCSQPARFRQGPHAVPGHHTPVPPHGYPHPLPHLRSQNGILHQLQFQPLTAWTICPMLPSPNKARGAT